MSTTAFSPLNAPTRDAVTARSSDTRVQHGYSRPLSLRHHWSRYATDGTVRGVTTKPINPTDTTQPTTPCTPLKASSPPGPTFGMRFTSTPRGARLARRLAAVRLDAWGIPYGTAPHDAVVLIVAELAANAVSHGHVPGRDSHLRLHATPDGRTVRVEVGRAARSGVGPHLCPSPTATVTVRRTSGNSS